jgi:hypothetical protein
MDGVCKKDKESACLLAQIELKRKLVLHLQKDLCEHEEVHVQLDRIETGNALTSARSNKITGSNLSFWVTPSNRCWIDPSVYQERVCIDVDALATEKWRQGGANEHGDAGGRTLWSTALSK